MNSITVAQLEMVPGTGGMSYVITLRDEGFIIIDGGQGARFYDTHAKILYEYLIKRSNGKKPLILGWFFTHFHLDHVACAGEFLKEHTEDITVKAFYINHPGYDDKTRDFEMEELLNSGMDMHPHAEKYYLKTGEKINFPYCVVDVLLTSENLNNNGETGPNNISSVFKVNFDSGKSFLVTGDSDHDRLLQLFDKNSQVYRPLEELKCDIYQVPHHGRSLATELDAINLKECYEQIMPKMVFFPIHKESYETCEFYLDKKWAENYYLIYESGAKCFHHTQTVTVDIADLSVEIE
ncbi:MAG: MBL fold metallo-hydrolase [Clostridia bacterium]|nr:MBL fold metallo-hydrolase [Clostridia bacterium]